MAMLLCFASPTFAQNVAKIGNTEYATLQAAMTNCAAAGDYTITLLKNSNEVFTFAQKSGVDITVDGDGYTFSGKITLNAGGGNLTFTDATIAPANSQTIYLNASTAPNLLFDGCTFKGTNKSGTIVYGYASNTSNSVTVKNCTADNLQYIVSCRQTGPNKVWIENVTATNMIYLVRTLKCPNVTVKNVTCDAVIGIDIKNDASGKLTLEDVNINVYTYGGSIYYPVSGSGAGKSWTITLKGNNSFSKNGVECEDNDWFSGNAGYVIVDANVAKIGEKSYATLADAIAAAGVGTTVEIEIIKDIVLDNTIVIPAGKSIVLNLNDKKISQQKACTASYQMIENNGSLTVTGNGVLSFKDTGAGDPSFGWGSYTINNRGTLVVENGTIEHLGEQNPGNGQPNKHMYCAIFQYSGSTTINGGVISTPTYRSVRLWKGEMAINGGTFEGQLWVQAVDNTAKLTINDGTFAPKGNDGSSVFVTNDQYDVEFTVEDGTFNGKIGCSNVDKLAGAIKGGKFTAAAMEGTNPALLAEDVNFGELNNGYYEVVSAVKVAKIDDVEYKTLAEALAAAQPEQTITLIADVTENVTISKKVTIDGDGKTYTGAMELKADATIINVNFDGKGYNGYAITTRGASYLTIEDCTVKNYGYGFVQLASATALTSLKNTTISDVNYGVKVDYSSAVVLENVDVNAAVAAVLNSNYGEKTITIKDSKLTILGTWKRNNNVKTTYLFEGANTINEFKVEANLDNFKLAAGATLTAPEGQNVTAADANKFKVVYVDGKYTLIPLTVMIGEQGYETLAEAFAAVKDGEVITLCENLTLDTETYTIADGKNVILDMNGKKISATDNSSKNFELFYIYGGLTVKGNGVIELSATNNRQWNAMSAIFHNRGGVLNIENGTFKHLGGTDMAYVVDNSGNYYGDATTNVANGVLSSSYIAIRNRMEQNSHGASGKAILNVAGGEISGTSRAIWGQAASTSTTAPATGEINVVGGTIGFIDVARSAGAEAMTTISGGSVASFKGEAGELKVTGEGKITGDVIIMTAAGETVEYVITADGVYTNAMAKIGDVTYASFVEAVAAAQAGETVSLLSDATGAGVVINKNITIDFGGHTYAVNKAVGSTGTETIGFQIMKDNNVTLKNGTLKSVAVAEGKQVKMLVQNYANLTIDNMNLVDETEHILYVLSNNSGNNLLSGNTNISTDAVAFDSYKYANYSAPVVTVETTGKIAGEIECNEGASIVIKGGTYTVNVKAWCAAGYDCTQDAEGNYSVAVNPSYGKVAKVGENYYATLREAVDAAPAGAEVSLLKNVTLEGGYADDPDAGLRIEKAITILGNKHTIDCGQFSKGIRIYINDSKKADVEFNNVTIKNDNPYGRCIDTRTKNIALEIKGNAKLIAHGTNSQPLTIGGNAATYRVRVSNATIDAGETGYGIISFVRITNNIEISSSSKISGLNAIYLKDGANNTTVLMGNGTYTGTNTNPVASGAFGTVVIEGDNNTIILNNEKSVVKAVSANGLDKAEQAAFLITEGATGNKIQITNAKAKVETVGDQARWAMVHADAASSTSIVVNKVDKQLAAECNGYQYVSLDDAFNAAAKYKVANVKLLTDVAFTTADCVTDCDGYSSIINVEGKELTFDLNGHSVKVDAYAEDLVNAKGKMLVAVFSTDGGGKLTLTDSSEAKTGKVEVTEHEGARVYSMITNYTDGCNVTINGGTYSANKVYDSLIYSGSNEGITVNNGNFYLGNVGEGQNGKPWIFNVLGQNEGHTTVNGGTFNADINHQFWGFEVYVPYIKALQANEENGTWTVVEAEAYVAEPWKQWDREVGYVTLEEAIAVQNKANNEVILVKDVEKTDMITVANGTTLVLNLNGKTIAATDNTTKNYSVIDNRGDLTITGAGKMTVTAKVNSGWGRYSAVIANNPGGKLTIDDATIEHLGGTDMAYGIDNLTNGKGTYAETIINGGTVKSPYRAIRQFLNGVEAENILTVNGGTIEGANKSIWMQDPSKNPNTGSLTVGEEAVLKGNVYLTVTEGSTEWPVEVMIAKVALDGESTVLSSNVPEGYAVSEYPSYWTVEALNVAELTIDDNCNSYANIVEKQVGELTYIRDFNDTKWQTIYLPFEVPAANLMDEFDVAYIYNASYKDNAATIDYVEIDETYVLKANYPYLIKAKEIGTKEIVVNDVALMPTEVNSIDCSSVFETFTFTGNYETVEGHPDEAAEAVCNKRHFVMNEGNWASFDVLNPFRVYMTIELRNGEAFPSSEEIIMRQVDQNGIQIEISNENDGNSGIYDLQGRRVIEPQKGQFYIINGEKVMY